MSSKAKLFGNVTYDNVPKGISRDRRLKGANKIVYDFLCDFEEKRRKFNLEPKSQKEIAEEIDYSERQVNRSIQVLKDYGLISVTNINGFTAEYSILNAAKSKFAEESKRPELFKEYTLKKEENEAETKPVPVEIITLTSEQMDLKYYIENKTGEALTKNKIKILTETATENKEIADIFATIKNIVDTIIDYKNKSKKVISNIFGYIKKSIKEYKAGQNPVENASSEYADTAMSLTLKLKYDYEERYHLTYKQCLALCTIAANKLYLDGTELYNFLLFDVINQTRRNTEIRDIFRYLITMINGYSEGYEYQETSYTAPEVPEVNENSYSANLCSYSELLKTIRSNALQAC